jgi:hypothetical protein
MPPKPFAAARRIALLLPVAAYLQDGNESRIAE